MEEPAYDCVRCHHAYTIGYMSLDLTLCAGCYADTKRGIVRRAMDPVLQQDREQAKVGEQLREVVYSAIASNPGVTYTELCESIGGDVRRLNTVIQRLIVDRRIRVECPDPRTTKYFPRT